MYIITLHYLCKLLYFTCNRLLVTDIEYIRRKSMHKKNDFVKVSKNLARSENNYVGPSK